MATPTTRGYLSTAEVAARLKDVPVDWHLAGAAAGQMMAGAPMTDGDLESARRVATGQSTVPQEAALLLAEIAAEREAE